MFKHAITYTDFNGTARTEDFYFHLSLPEVTRLEGEIGQPLEEYIQTLTSKMDLNSLIVFIERIILSSYGEKTPDGKSFMKTPALRSQFEHSQAYAELFEQLLTDVNLSRRFGESVADNGKAKRNVITPTVVHSGSTNTQS